jgi:hypothetical protein
MFRRGGEVGGGITSGMRSNFSKGTYKERFDKIMEQYSTPAVDPIAQLLIQGGLRGLSETGGGGTLGNLARAFEPAVGQAFQTMGSQRAAEKQAALTGLEIDIDEQRRKEALEREDRRIKEGQEFQRELLGDKLEGQKAIKMLDLAGQKQQAEKEAAIILGPDATPEQIQQKASEILQQRIFGVEERFMENLKAKDIESIKANLGFQSDDVAENYYNFQRNSLAELRASNPEFKNLTFVGPVTTNSKTGKYKLKNKRPGIYFDPFLQNVVIIDSAKDVKILRADQL